MTDIAMIGVTPTVTPLVIPTVTLLVILTVTPTMLVVAHHDLNHVVRHYKMIGMMMTMIGSNQSN
jgi:hypothetical protein